MRRRPITSLSGQVRLSVWTITTLLAVPVIVSLVVMFIYAANYQGIIHRMSQASALKPRVETEIPERLFSVIAGRMSYSESEIDELVEDIDRSLDDLLNETSEDGQLMLTVARRTMDTLSQYTHQVEDGMATRRPIDEMEVVVDEVRGVCALVGDMLEAFVSTEIASAADINARLRLVFLVSAGAEVLLLLMSLWRTRLATRRLTRAIAKAIDDLESIVRRLAGGQLQERVTGIEVQEMQELAEQINVMANRLETLIQQIRLEQVNLAKSELRTLQAQINPHFLYNTLDTIIWQAESGKADEVIRLTRSLSDFFRILLSAGADWIPVEQEIRHVTAYLRIQKTRYRDILDYSVETPEDVGDIYMVKLLLQPLVENALYHGIKAKRGGGLIRIRVEMEEGRLHFSVSDNGKGMDDETLERVRGLLGRTLTEVPTVQETGTEGFGLRNVDMRIRLYYQQAEGLKVEADRSGTCISFSVPVKKREDFNDESVSGG
ncbi:MAG: sensor histidine kinase [Clostridia bacterium]|nr:sensor histidine kinase [Clostridia bacterium]